MPRLGDEDTSPPPPLPPAHAVLRHCLAFLSHEQQKLLWDQSDISSGKSRLTSPLPSTPTSTSTPAPSSAPSSSIYLMPKTFNVIKTDNAENAQNFKARAELKVCEAASESFKIPLRPRSTHLPHPSHTYTHTGTHTETLSQLATVTCTCHKALKLLAGITHASISFLPSCLPLKTFAWHAHTHIYTAYILYNCQCVCCPA